VDDIVGKVTPGQVVRVLRGRDRGKYAIVVKVIDERYVLIADGDKRKFDRPKKKNVLHLQILNDVRPEVAASLRETGKVTNAKLRHALLPYRESAPRPAEAGGESAEEKEV